MTPELGEKWYERMKSKGEMSVRSDPLTSRARGKFHVAASVLASMRNSDFRSTMIKQAFFKTNTCVAYDLESSFS